MKLLAICPVGKLLFVVVAGDELVVDDVCWVDGVVLPVLDMFGEDKDDLGSDEQLRESFNDGIVILFGLI